MAFSLCPLSRELGSPWEWVLVGEAGVSLLGCQPSISRSLMQPTTECTVPLRDTKTEKILVIENDDVSSALRHAHFRAAET